jgi:hypothetical protein
MTDSVLELLDMKGLRLVLFLEALDFGSISTLFPDGLKGDPRSVERNPQEEDDGDRQEAQKGQRDFDLLGSRSVRGPE